MNAKSIVMVLLIAVVSMAFVGSASAATYYVNPGDSIQAAINGAADGDTIALRNGAYTENVVVNKSVAIVSRGVDVDYESHHCKECHHDYYWWVYWKTDYTTSVCWAYYAYHYSGEVSVTAADPTKDVFRVESDDVLIMNIDVDYDASGSYVYASWDYTVYYWWFPYKDVDCTKTRFWEYHAHDNPMIISGAYKHDAAGVYVAGASGTQLRNLILSGNDNGVILDGASDTAIIDCEVNNNDKEGILMLDSTEVYVYNVIVIDSGKRGIEAENCADVELDQVAVVNSKKNGIDFTAVDGVLMDTVDVEDSGKTGVKLDDCTDVELVYSYIANNGRSGLTMTDCDGTAVTDNEIAYNTKYGMKTHNAVNVIFDNNDVHDNGKADVKHFTSGSP